MNFTRNIHQNNVKNLNKMEKNKNKEIQFS